MNCVVLFFRMDRARARAFIWPVLTAALLLVCSRAVAAPGDILSATVEPNGWVLDVVVNTTITSAVPDYGFTNQPLGAFTLVGLPPGKIVLNMKSAGFDDSASPMTFPRT